MTSQHVISFWETIASILKNGEKVFLALVADHTKHSPGTTGAKMIVAKNHDTMGTVGGGIMEHKLIDRAVEILDQGNFEPELHRLVHRKSGGSERSGMICSGEQTNIYMVLRHDNDMSTIEKILELIKENKPGKLMISPSGLSVENFLPDTYCNQVPLTTNGKEWNYNEELLNYNRIAIIGGGHCSLSLSRLMKNLGYHVSVFDTRSGVSTVSKNRYADSIQIIDDYRNAADLLSHSELTYVVVMTTDVASDVRGVLGSLNKPFPFIGVMGSQAKINEINKRLKNEGVSDDKTSRLIAPVGIPMLSNTPEEIAVSVAAQILQYKNQEMV